MFMYYVEFKDVKVSFNDGSQTYIYVHAYSADQVKDMLRQYELVAVDQVD